MSAATTEPRMQRALSTCIAALRRVADYELDEALQRRIQDLGEQKEFLDPGAHDVLMALVAFSQQRTIDKLEAQVALQHLGEVVPDLICHGA